ncbi:MAG: replication initiator protein A [Alphaproteobacteria bacterium]|nr:replication initiator protein A [Alphaproteobacteria bacterium]
MPLRPALEELSKLSPVSAVQGAIPVCNAQILMAYPFFSLAKAPRFKPIDYKSGNAFVQVDANEPSGIATIWDADILIWAASQIVQLRNSGQAHSRRIHARPYEILGFLGRSRSKRSYDRLRNSLDRLKATQVTTSLGQDRDDALYRFNWIDDWQEKKDLANRAAGMEIFFSEWFYKIISQPQSCLTLDPQYFQLTGGLERWLYLVARKHGGRQEKGWSFDFHHLHRKSASLAAPSSFSREIRNIAKRGRLIDYDLSITRNKTRTEQLLFLHAACGYLKRPIVRTDNNTIVPSGRGRSCYQKDKALVRPWEKSDYANAKYFSKKESKNTKARHLENSTPTGLLGSQISQKNDRQDEKTRPIVRDRQEILVDLLSRKRIPLPGGFL